MSTCPDADLYSAFVDGEVPSPWKEKLESHLASCPSCEKQANRYKRLHELISNGGASPTALDLEASYARLCARRSAVVASMGAREAVRIPEWVHSSVRMPVMALAALLVAAVFIPALFVIRTTSSLRGQNEQFSLIQQNAQNLKTLTSMNPVYSPDLSTEAVPVRSITDTGRNVFTMVDYARQFAENQNLFSDADIIIIKLPKLTTFSETEELFHSSNETLLQAAGYYK